MLLSPDFLASTDYRLCETKSNNQWKRGHVTCLLLSTDNKTAGENPSDELVKSHVSFRSSRENSRGAITFVLYWHRCQITTAKHSRLSYVKGSYLRGIQWLIAGQSASMLTSFSVCREEWGGALPLLLNGSLSLEFQSEQERAEKIKSDWEGDYIVTIWQKEKKTSYAMKSRKQSRLWVTVRDGRSRRKREIRKEALQVASEAKWVFKVFVVFFPHCCECFSSRLTSSSPLLWRRSGWLTLKKKKKKKMLVSRQLWLLIGGSGGGSSAQSVASSATLVVSLAAESESGFSQVSRFSVCATSEHNRGQSNGAEKAFLSPMVCEVNNSSAVCTSNSRSITHCSDINIEAE